MSEPDVREEPTRTEEPGGLTEAGLNACVQAAIAAPSIHNSQPWRFRIRDGGVDVFADWDRRLAVIDPSGRELLISIGAAVFNARLAMRQQARAPMLRLFPEPAEPDLVARVVPGRPVTPDGPLNLLAAAIPRRHTNRRPFARSVIPVSVIEELIAAAATEGATLGVAGPVARGAILSLVRTAEQQLRRQGIYRAELAEWTLAVHGRRDGVPPQAFGPWDALEALPLRDFGLTQPGLRRSSEYFEPYPTIVVLSTDGDTADRWLHAGQALQRVLLVATVRGLAATPMSQPLEIPALRELTTDTAAGRWAQVILRLGYAQPPTTPTPRRPLADVLLAGSP
jgi:nitroreductase